MAKVEIKNTQGVTDVVDAIHKTTTLTKDQIYEVFRAFANLIEAMVKSNHSKGLAITLPYIGKIHFTLKKGRKKGSTYTRFVNADPVNGGAVMEKYVIEEDEPDYFRLVFTFSPALQERCKNNSKGKLKNETAEKPKGRYVKRSERPSKKVVK